MAMEIILNNINQLTDTLTDIGKFAEVCKKKKDPTKNYSDVVLKRIALQCIDEDHKSPTYKAHIYFTVTGVSHVESHQQVRHSLGIALNQESGVFSVLDPYAVVYPPSYKALTTTRPELLTKIKLLHNDLADCYKDLMALGISKSDARYILPMGLETSFNVEFNLESFRAFLRERLCMKAQWEIRAVANEMRRQVLEVVPELEPYLVPKCVYLHHCPMHNSCGYYDAYLKEKGEKDGKVDNIG